MNGINIKVIISVSLGLVMGLYVMIEVLLSGRSSLGQLYLFAAIGSFVFALASPKKAVYVVLLTTVYIDVFKRMMVIGGEPTLVDVAYVLAIPPLLIAGAIITVFLSAVIGNNRMTKDMVVSLIVSCIVVLVTVVGSAISGGGSGIGKMSGIVNQGFYAFLFFIIPNLFPSEEERRKLLHFSFLTFIPSVFYMFWQRKFGYAQFEYDYLMSGLTIEKKNFAESLGQLRCFSTFNGAGTAATLFSIFLLYCFVPLRPNNKPASFMQRFGKLLLAPLFILAAYFTIVRTGWFCGLGTLVAYVFMHNRLLLRAGVLSAIFVFATVVLFAPIALKYNWLQKMEYVLQDVVLATTNDPTLKRAVVLGTARDRLQGWANLTQEPRLWQPFGFAASDINIKNTTNSDFKWGHDALIDALIQYGYVPVFFGLSGAAFSFIKLFGFMYRLNNKSQAFKNLRLCLSFTAGILVGAMGNGAQFRNYPQNFFFCLWLAIPFATYQQAMRERKKSSQALLLSSELPMSYPDLASAASVGMISKG
jgi:hypothetical protein